MPSRFSAQSGKGAVFVALALVATLLVPSVYTWAVKSGAAKPGVEPFGQIDRRDVDPDALAHFQRLASPPQDRALDLSPLGNYNPKLPNVDKRKGLVFTQVGFFNPKDGRSFEGLPADLRPVAAHPAPQGKGLGLGSSVGIIQITEAALKDKGYDGIEAQIKALGGKVLESVPDRSLVVRGNPKTMQDLVAAPFVEAALPYAPAFKLDPVMGRQMLVNKARASKIELDVHVVAWSKEDTDAVLKDMKAGRGGDTVQLLEDGRTIWATLDKNEIKKLAKNELVRGISEVGEYQLSAFTYIETPPVIQVGETEHTGAATPYWDAGVNGGGCGNPASPPIGNTNTGNCGTAVPGVVVAVLDNGASTDAATLAHSTATLTETQINTLITTGALGSHRKIRSYAIGGSEATTPLGSSCDSVLFGSQTHGNVISGMIAGNASALGYQFQKNTNAGSFGDVRRMNLDGSARGARLAVQDFGGSADCNKAELVERGNFITPVSLSARMDDAYAVGARLHVMPFGSPNWGANGTTSAGTYGNASSDPHQLDLYLANNLEYQVFVPVGNKGFNLVNGRDVIPDYFDGDSSAGSDGTSLGQLLQISPPATAKNVVSSGATCTDTLTMFGAFNEEENVQNYTSKGPATSASLRAAPIVTAVGNDRAPTGGGPTPMGMYTVKSKDNNQGGAVDIEIDEQARGTSFGAANLAASAALIEDYLAQGFYPTGDRVQGDRVPNVSGAAMKAMLAASANISEQLIGANASSVGMNGNDIQVATTRGSTVLVSGVEKVLVNNQQGYGRAIVSQILPIANWPNVAIPPDFVATGDTAELPAVGLLMWDGIDPDGAGALVAEPPINNTTTQTEHTFRVLGTTGQIRICLAWPDPPGELLVNDLDLEVIAPSAKTYDGNVYNPSSQVTGQWGLNRLSDKGDIFNPIECVHLTENPDANPATNDNQIEPGIWTVRVKRGAGGATPGQITANTGANEDANGNNRLDGGEDLDADGLLDKNGQVYALVAAGPLVANKGAGNPNFTNFPLAMTRLDKIRYSCADSARIQVWDGDAAAAAISGGTTVRVYNAAGSVIDTETNLAFTGANGVFTSGPLSVRLGATGTAGNGILEGDTGYTVESTYVDATAASRTAFGRAPIDCEPNFIGGVFTNAGERNTQDVLFGGCDTDQSFDSNEVVTYSVAVVNNSLDDEYTDVSATLTVCAVPFNPDGTCSNASTPLTVLDSPKNIGRLPVGQPAAVTFSIRVGAVGAIGKVYLRLGLGQTGSEKVLSRVAYTFSHALGSDRGSLHYSTDYPNGSGSITRDLNRSFVIEPSDRPGLTLGLLDESVQFSSLFVTDPSTTRINNQIQGGDEAYPALGLFSTGADANSNGVLDRHTLAGGAPSANDLLPWNFDNNNGGWYVAQDAATILGAATGTLPSWHYVKNGTCGFQTQSKSNCVIPSGGTTGGTPGFDPDGSGPSPCAAITAGAFTGGVWHTGSGVAGSCSISTGISCYLDSDCPGGETCVGGADNPECGNYGLAFNGGTPTRAEFRYDIMISPVIEKVNQGLDANGFEYTVEYQRLAFNATNQIKYDSTLYVNVDNDVDTNNNNALIKPGVARGDGLQYYDFSFTGPMDPVTSATQFDQYVFGPTTDPDGSLTKCQLAPNAACTLDSQCQALSQGNCGLLTGDETGFPGFDRQSVNGNATKPIIPNPNPQLRPYPGPGEVFVGEDTVAGPSRSVEADFVDYEDNGLQFFTPGRAGNRWQIGMGFLVFESPNPGPTADGDFGWAIDDVAFEWDEVHPVAESTAACDRIGIGGPTEIAAGCRCATLSVDRTNLYDCNETVQVTVSDPRYATGAVSPCVAGSGAVDTISVNVWSNSEPFPGETVILTETGGTTGVFTGQIGVSGIFNTPGAVYTTPGTETNLFFAYEDNTCDSNHNHLAGQADFDNLDGDGLLAASGRDGICNTDDDNAGLFGADLLCGFNPGSGAIDDTGDNCATVYNPVQGDADGDNVGGAVSGGVYLGCDNCPTVYNPSQADGDLDGVGNACDYDDIDQDGVIDAVDNCPDVSNPGQEQTGGSAPRGTACAGNGDTDSDTIIDKNDNCVLTSNTSQVDADNGSGGFVIPLGDACDGDCQGTCSGGANAGKACRWGTGNAYGFTDQCPGGTCSAVACSSVNDDADVDAVADSDDNCAVQSNPTVLPGSDPPLQQDDNFNGIGNQCDPVGSYDENLDGIPDDTASGSFFAMAATCKNVPLANLVVLSTIVRDRGELGTCTGGPTTQACSTGTRVGYACTTGADCPGGACVSTANACGDGDAFSDPGERVRVTLALQNITGFGLTGVTLSATTADPDVQCVLDSTIAIASFPNGSTVDTKTLSPGDDPAQPGDGRFFEAVISPTASTTNPGQPSRANFTLALNSNEVGGTAQVVPISLLLDLDIPAGVSVTYTTARCDGEIDPAHAGADCSVTNVCTPTSACRPGLVWEDFEDVGTGNPACVGVPATGGQPQPNCFANTIGFIEKNAAADSDTTMVGTPCFGFVEVLACGPNTAACGGCQIDPDFQTDWHFEQAGSAPLAKAFRGLKSAHWGRHTQTATRAGDTTPHRQIEAFVTNPINLTIIPGAGDLFLSFWHIVSLADDNRINFQVGQAGDRADVQIAVDLDAAFKRCGVGGISCTIDADCAAQPVTTCTTAAGDNFSRWTKLAPFQNVGEHTTQVFSWFGYCEFTPADAASQANPTVFHDTICFPDPIWSHSGNVIGTNIQAIFNAQGPGQLGSQGEGVWVQSAFSLLDYIGQRVKIRWVGTAWAFGIGWNSYMEPPAGGNPFDIATSDDGWWVDSVRITGAITAPAAPVLEPTTIPLSTQCPASAAANCDETKGLPGSGQPGFVVNFAVRDSDGDGTVVNGENIILDASQTLNPGGCADGVPQYRFSKDPGAVMLQDWSTAASLSLGNTTDGDLYKVEVRCSSDASCTTTPFSPPTGVVPGGCPVWAGPVPAPFEPTVTFTLAAASSNMNMSMSNMLNILFVPGHAMPPPTYGHTFARTDALPVGTAAAGNNGGISGVIAAPNATINEAFKNVVGGAQVPAVPPAVPGVGSCDVNAAPVPCASPVAPAVISWTDATVPAVGTLYYYLGDTFTSPGGPAKTFGPYGPTRIGGVVGVRTATISCP